MMDWSLAKGSLVEKLRRRTNLASLCIVRLVLVIFISLATMVLAAPQRRWVRDQVQGCPCDRGLTG
jgi:hypothetical protein